jgi:ionotropic glutamate receptor
MDLVVRDIVLTFFFQYPPFIIPQGNTSFDGYCMDLLHEIQNILKFDYELYPSPDGLVGSMDDKGNWNGIVKELMEKVCLLDILFRF